MVKYFLETRIGDELVCSLVLYIVELRSRKLAVIEEVKTVEGYRHKGYGKSLVNRAIKKAKKLNCDIVELCYNPTKGDMSRKFYTSCGFIEDGTVRAKIVLNEENMKKTDKW